MSLTLKTHQLLEKSKIWVDKKFNNEANLDRSGRQKSFFDLEKQQIKSAYLIVGAGAIGLSLMAGSIFAPENVKGTIFSAGGLLLTLGTPIGLGLGGLSLFLGDKINDFIKKISLDNKDIKKSFLLDGTLLALPIGEKTPVYVSRLELAEDFHSGILSNKYETIYNEYNKPYSTKELNIEKIFNIRFEFTEQQKYEKSMYDSKLLAEIFHRNKLIETDGDIALSHLSELQKLQKPTNPNYGCKETFIERIKKGVVNTFSKNDNSENKLKP